MKLAQYREITKTLYPEIEAVLGKHGLKLGKVSAGVSEFDGTVRLTLQLADANLRNESGEATTPERERWNRFASSYGLDPAWLGKQWSAGRGLWFEIAGLKDTRGAKCVLLKRSDGKTFVTTPDAARAQLARRPVGALTF